MKLFIFVRQGCCLCDQLITNLKQLNMKVIKNDLELVQIDIDRYDLYQNNFKKYDQEVPVIAVKKCNSSIIRELPRVSPRLKDLQLKNWLQKNINNLL